MLLETGRGEFKAAWSARDSESYLAQWRFGSPEAETEERAFLKSRFEAPGTTLLGLAAPGVVPAAARRASCYGEIATIEEPWGTVEQVVFRMERREQGWSVISRQLLDRLEGLAHLSLDPTGFDAAAWRGVRKEFAEMLRTREYQVGRPMFRPDGPWHPVHIEDVTKTAIMKGPLSLSIAHSRATRPSSALTSAMMPAATIERATSGVAHATVG